MALLVQVYFGHWNGQEVAIKVAAPRNGDNASCAVEFQREVRGHMFLSVSFF